MGSKKMVLPKILVLTPMKNTASLIDGYFSNLLKIDFPKRLISLAILEGDSHDDTFALLEKKISEFSSHFNRLELYKRDYGFIIPDGLPRWTPAFQYTRRIVLAKARNYLLSRALDDEEWVLWLDADIIEYPSDIIQRLLSYDKLIIQPDCVTSDGARSFDRNAWAEKGTIHIDNFRGLPSPQRLDSVGATMLLVNADLHREGLIFPPFAFGDRHEAIRDVNPCLPTRRAGEIESEGLGIMALSMGYQAWAAQDIMIKHAAE